jgi:Ca2+-binding EF-hand superfamily protein
MRNSNSGMGDTNYRADNESQNRNPYYNYDQIQFNEFLSKLMDIELKIENVKSDLANIQEFNIEDAFRIFENEKEYLTEEDLKNGLKSIGVFPNAQDIKLLMKRFDLFKKGNINFADFFDIIVPFEQNIRNEIENRKPKCYPRRGPDVSTNQTLYVLRNLFNLIINSENEINEMRKMFGTLRLNLRDIFALLDEGGKGYFTNEELMRYLQNNGLLSNVKSADLLFIRLDKNRNGKIDYYEVEEEMETLY